MCYRQSLFETPTLGTLNFNQSTEIVLKTRYLIFDF